MLIILYIRLIGKNKRQANLCESFREDIIRQYTNTNLTKDGKLLVLFMYNTHEEMRLTRMHPEAFMIDTTHGTNKDRKELFTIAGKDGNNNGFNALRAYIPNQQQWIFHLIFSECLCHWLLSVPISSEFGF